MISLRIIKSFANKNFTKPIKGLSRNASATFVNSKQNYHAIPLRNKFELINISSAELAPPKKKVRKPERFVESQEFKRMVVLCTAEEYNLEELSNAFCANWPQYKEVDIAEDIEDNVIPYQATVNTNEERQLFFFREGSFACWNMSSSEIEKLLEFVKPFEIRPFDRLHVNEEKEEMDYIFSDEKTKFLKGNFRLEKASPDRILEQYAFSNAVALSVKLAVLETTLNDYINSIKFITLDMKSGNRISLSREQVFRKTGDLFALRHHINLSLDLLDTPDFYWDRQELEQIFQQTGNFLNISKRTKVMNEKLNHCTELMSLISGHLSDKHHVRLEWMIIVLIMVEVGFEVLHYIG